MSGDYTEEWLEGPQKTQFYCRTYTAESPKAVLVFAHGFIEHIGRYEHVFPHWKNRGISVFLFDQRGFGRTALDTEHKSKDSSYGKTSLKFELGDLEWALNHTKKTFGDVPLFLMGHSMGGGIVASFASRPEPPPSPSCVSMLSGVIMSSPFLQQPSPPNKVLLWVGSKASVLAPWVTVESPVNPKDLSHDPKVGEAYVKDPLVKFQATLKCIADMFSNGDALLDEQYSCWPPNLPVLMLHGTGDKVTSHTATEQFSQKVPAKDKQLILFPDAYHELHNELEPVRSKFIDDCITWAEKHLQPANPAAPTPKL